MIIVAQPSRKKINEAINNLNTTLESIYLKAWKDGYRSEERRVGKE